MKKPYDLFIDYDGVLVDFYDGVYKLLGHHFNDPSYVEKVNREERNKKIEQHPDFWEKLKPMKDYKELWSWVKVFHPSILTAFAHWDEENSRKGKILWNLKHTKVPANKFHIVSRDNKQLYALDHHGNPNVLVDDFLKNVNEWEKRGGIGIHHVNAQSTIQKLKGLGFENENDTK